MEVQKIVHKMEKEYCDYLTDESKMKGWADAIAFPTTTGEVAALIEYAKHKELAVTIQGGRTGLSGGAVPEGGLILNLEKMKQITGMELDGAGNGYLLWVQPGILLQELREAIRTKAFDTATWEEDAKHIYERFLKEGEFFFPPDPTETMASIGGMVSTNASGARSFCYGPTRAYIEGLEVVFSDGSVKRMHRGQTQRWPEKLQTLLEREKNIGSIQNENQSCRKTTAAYYFGPDLNWVDLMTGSEGTLGVITGVLLRLLPAPAVQWGILCMAKEEKNAFMLHKRLMEGKKQWKAQLAALEYIGHSGWELLRQENREEAMEFLPLYEGNVGGAVYLEVKGECEEEVLTALGGIMTILDELDYAENGSVVATNAQEMERMKCLRHAVPEAANCVMARYQQQIPELTVICTDLAVAGGNLEAMVEQYELDCKRENLQYILYGHMGDNHLHVNLLPKTFQQYCKGMELYQSWAERAVALGGTVSAEHGIGRQKAKMLPLMGEEKLQVMREIKNILDPDWRLNPGVKGMQR